MKRSNRTINGVAMVETLLVLPILLMLGLGIVHLGLVYQAKSNLEYAALMAARVGASTSIDITEMRQEVLRRMQAADTRIEDLSDLSRVEIEVINPDMSVFSDWGGPPTEGAVCASGYSNSCEIPNDSLVFRPTTLGGSSGVSIQDANILRIKVVYYYDSRVPLMKAFYVDRRAEGVETGVELIAYSTVRMQSPARLTDSNINFIAN